MQIAVSVAIRRAIQANEMVPGQRLIEADLCALTGASRRAVRTSLVLLEQEGLVERVPNFGARVRAIDLDEALEVAEVRLEVETLCVTRACQRITDIEIEQLQRLARELEACVVAGDVSGFAKVTNEVVKTYVQIAGHAVARETLDRLRDRSTRHISRVSYTSEWPKIALPLRLNVIEAICRRDVGRARQALRRHSEKLQQAMIALGQEKPAFLGRPKL